MRYVGQIITLVNTEYFRDLSALVLDVSHTVELRPAIRARGALGSAFSDRAQGR